MLPPIAYGPTPCFPLEHGEISHHKSAKRGNLEQEE